MQERRNAQISDLKNLQNLYKDSETKVQLIKDELKIGNQITRETFEKNKLQSSPQASLRNLSAIRHAKKVEQKGSFFKDMR